MTTEDMIIDIILLWRKRSEEMVSGNLAGRAFLKDKREDLIKSLYVINQCFYDEFFSEDEIRKIWVDKHWPEVKL